MRSYSYNTPIQFVPNIGVNTCTTSGQSYCGTKIDPGGGYNLTVNSNISISLKALIIRSCLNYGEPACKNPTYKALYYCTPNNNNN
jgi:hypothetical protein